MIKLREASRFSTAHAQRGAVSHQVRAGLALMALAAMAMVLALRHEWLGLLGLPLAYLAAVSLRPPQSPKGNTSLSQVPEVSELHRDTTSGGRRLMIARVLPVWNRQLDALAANIHSSSDELLHCFTTLLDLQTQLETELGKDGEEVKSRLLVINRELAVQCECALQGLQFSDRVSQMLVVLDEDIQRFIARLDDMESATEADAKVWIEELTQRFTTDEQHQFHSGDPPIENTKRVEFF